MGRAPGVTSMRLLTVTVPDRVELGYFQLGVMDPSVPCGTCAPAPRAVKIEIAPRCNYRCGFRALRTRESQPEWDMDFALFKRITKQMRDAGVQEIGVPLVFLTSNASMVFPEATEAGEHCIAYSDSQPRPEKVR